MVCGKQRFLKEIKRPYQSLRNLFRISELQVRRLIIIQFWTYRLLNKTLLSEAAYRYLPFQFKPFSLLLRDLIRRNLNIILLRSFANRIIRFCRCKEIFNRNRTAAWGVFFYSNPLQLSHRIFFVSATVIIVQLSHSINTMIFNILLFSCNL